MLINKWEKILKERENKRAIWIEQKNQWFFVAEQNICLYGIHYTTSLKWAEHATT